MATGKKKPAEDAAGGDGMALLAGAEAAPILPQYARAVKSPFGVVLLCRQAAAAEERALALAAWHRERAARYLARVDLGWAEQQYRRHVDEAAYQDALAARHAAVRRALGEVSL